MPQNIEKGKFCDEKHGVGGMRADEVRWVEKTAISFNAKNEINKRWITTFASLSWWLFERECCEMINKWEKNFFAIYFSIFEYYLQAMTFHEEQIIIWYDAPYNNFDLYSEDYSLV